MARKKNNDAARQLWAQIFERQAADEFATLADPDHDHEADEKGLRDGLAEAGWSDDEIERRIEAVRGERAPSTGDSPGVTASIERIFNFLCDDVEAAMVRLKLESHTRLTRGIDPIAGPSAAMTNVIMTDQGIVSVSSFFFRYCGLIARAFTRTLHINPFAWEADDCDDAAGRSLLISKPALIHYWFMAFVSFAATGTQMLAPFKPAQKHEAILFEQIARAMELFAIAHEYGHHHNAHGRNANTNPVAHEFEADQFALRILYEIEKKPFIAINPYISSGAGGVILLRSLDILRLVSERLLGEKLADRGTHPPPSDRIEKFESVAVLKPQEYAALLSFRLAATRILDCVETLMLESIDQFPESLRAKLIELRATVMRPADE